MSSILNEIACCKCNGVKKMKNYFEILQKVSLFKGIEEQDLLSLLSCLSPRQKRYKKNAVVFRSGDTVSEIGIVLTGSILIAREDEDGRRNIVNKLVQGDLFAETFVCARIKEMPITAFAEVESEVQFIDYHRIVTGCSISCPFHYALIRNMLSVLAEKNIILNQKLEYLSKRTIREKLIAYLYDSAKYAGKRQFQIPFNRQELADYLYVDRSAMSKELGKMKKEGIIEFYKDRFELLT